MVALIDALKNATQRVTGLILGVVGISLFCILIVVLHLFGIWAWIDSFFPDWRYVTLFIISRLGIVYGACGFTYWFAKIGGKTGFFWFKPEISSTETVDRSMEIYLVIMASLVAMSVSELIIRIITQIPPPYK